MNHALELDGSSLMLSVYFRVDASAECRVPRDYGKLCIPRWRQCRPLSSHLTRCFRRGNIPSPDTIASPSEVSIFNGNGVTMAENLSLNSRLRPHLKRQRRSSSRTARTCPFLEFHQVWDSHFLHLSLLILKMFCIKYFYILIKYFYILINCGFLNVYKTRDMKKYIK